jgi:prolyl-tRNA editing enzyme YbaK/EbsC (Cys-tRNA(Pro) deacylase)
VAAPDLTDHPAVRRVLQTLAIHHVVPEVVTLPEAVRTAAAAAAALGITPAEIANSLIFRAHTPEGTISPMLILTSGAHKVDLVKVAELVDGVDHLDRADADFVLEVTGFAIGGVAPVGHRSQVRTLVDVSLSRYRPQPHRVPDHLRRAAAGHRRTCDRGGLSPDA